MAPLQEQIQAINQRLRAYGIEAVQEIRMTDREGKTIGQVKYGYRPQYVFDSVNDVLGPENWRYELTREEIFENQAVAEVLKEGFSIYYVFYAKNIHSLSIEFFVEL